MGRSVKRVRTTTPATRKRPKATKATAADEEAMAGGRDCGVHEFLDTHLWPKFKPVVADWAVYGSSSGGGGGGAGGGTAGGGGGGASASARRRQGLFRGTVVDHELEAWCKDFASHRTRYGDDAYLEGKHPFTVKAIRAFQEWKWSPLMAQVPVRHPSRRIATRVDMIVYDHVQKKPLLIEIKTGGRGYFEFDSGQTFYAPLDHIKSTALNHALAQAIISTSLYCGDTRQRRLGINSYYVVLISDAFTKRFDRPPWEQAFLTRYHELLQTVVALRT